MMNVVKASKICYHLQCLTLPLRSRVCVRVQRPTDNTTVHGDVRILNLTDAVQEFINF